MGKIQPNPNYQPDDPEEVDDIDELGSDDRPGIEPGGEEFDIASEGEVIVPARKASEEEAPDNDEVKPITFKTQAELDAYVAGKNKPVTPTPPKVETKPDTPEVDPDEEEIDKLEFWKGHIDPETGQWVGEKPRDWNDFARTILKQVAPGKVAPKILSKIQSMTKKEQEEIEAINAEFDVEYDELATSGIVPKRGTKEGDDVNAQISTIGGTYGLTSMKKAHELWAKIPKEQGGGLDYKPAAPKSNPSKLASRLIGSSKRTNAAVKTKAKIPYAKLHGARSVDELIDDE